MAKTYFTHKIAFKVSEQLTLIFKYLTFIAKLQIYLDVMVMRGKSCILRTLWNVSQHEEAVWHFNILKCVYLKILIDVLLRWWRVGLRDEQYEAIITSNFVETD